MSQAIRIVVSRHEALRARFSPDGDVQYFGNDDDVEIPCQDLSDLPADERSARAKAVSESEGGRTFDIADGSPVRFRLVKLAEDEHRLIFSAHQITCDSSSYRVVLRELGQIYSALRKGQANPLPPAPSFRGYMDWTKSRKRADVLDSGAYWLRQYEKPLGRMDLPLDRPRPPVRSYRGDRRSLTLSRQLWRSLQDVAADRRAASFDVLLAAFEALLYRLSGQSDLVVGIPRAGQGLWGRNDSVGQFGNLLPLRLEFEGGSTFAELLTSVQGATLDAREYPAFSLGSLLEKLRLEQDPSRIPLAPVCFDFDRTLSEIEFDGLTYELDRNRRRGYEFELGFSVVQVRDSCRVDCDYNSDLFDDKTIDRWLSHYEALLQAIVASQDVSIDRL